MPKTTSSSTGSLSHSTHTHIHGGVTISSPLTSGEWTYMSGGVTLEQRIARLEQILNVAPVPTDEELANEAIKKAWEVYQEKENEIFSIAFAEMEEAKEELEIIKKLSKE